MAQTAEQRRAAAKRHRLDVLYRITPEEQDAVEKYQRTDPDYGILLERGNKNDKRDAQLYTDHRHSDGLVRGRLAYLINKGLGTIENAYKERTPKILRALADYLDSPPFSELFGDRYGMIGQAKLKKKVKVYGSAVGPIKFIKKAGKK